jgi:hypothetical protein
MERNDRIERNATYMAGANQVEGLVRDNRVEVRVLFGASRKEPANRRVLSFSEALYTGSVGSR